MKLLELFSGTGSVGRIARRLGWDVVSLDLKNADISTDILNWDFKTYEPKQKVTPSKFENIPKNTCFSNLEGVGICMVFPDKMW